MKTAIFYFTGTGNSLKISKDLQKELKDTILIPVSTVIVNKEIKILYDCIGIIFPVYMWGIPNIIKRFLKKIKTDRYIFVLINYSGSPGSTLKQVKKTLQINGTKLSAGFGIKMPESAVTLTNPFSIKKVTKLFAEERNKIVEVANDIKKNKENIIKTDFFLINWIFSGIINKIISPRLKTWDKSYWVDDKCDICGICQKICPVKNIEIINDKIIWQHNCEQCMACIQWCPKSAIQYGKKTIKRDRYRNPNVQLKEMIHSAVKL